MTVKDIAEKMSRNVLITVTDGTEEEVIAKFDSDYYDSIKADILDQEVDGIIVINVSRGKPQMELTVGSAADETEPGEEEPEPDDGNNDEPDDDGDGNDTGDTEPDDEP